MSRGKARPVRAVTLACDNLIAVTTVAAPASTPLDSEEGRGALAAKLRGGHPLTPAERSFLAQEVEPKRKRGRPAQTNAQARAQSLNVAQYFIYLRATMRAINPREKNDTIVGKVAEIFGCGERTVHADIARAKQLHGGAWWRTAEQIPALPTRGPFIEQSHGGYVNEFYGSPLAWMSRFAGARRYVVKIKN